MGVGRRAPPAGSPAEAQGRAKAPRMALDGLSGAGTASEAGEVNSAILGHPWRPGGLLPGRLASARKPGEGSAHTATPSGRTAFHAAILAWPERAVHDTGRIDDLDRHLAARGRLNRLVALLTRKYRREFPAYKYEATTEGSHLAVAALLSQYGGLPKDTPLNGVPAEILEQAVEAFAAYFGLGEAASGNLPGSGSFPATVDPQPHKRREPEMPPW